LALIFGRGVAISIGCKQLCYLATAIASKQTVMELVAAAVAPAGQHQQQQQHAG